MKNILLLLFGFNCTLLLAQDLNLMTYNMRLDLGIDGENDWQYRKDFFVNQLLETAPDFIGTQEGLPNQIKYIDEKLTKYSHLGIGREGGKGKGEYCALFYNKEKFEVMESSTFWLSKTPEKVSKNWDAAFLRICTYGLFKDKKSGKLFWIFNTHLDNEGEEARRKGIRLILKKIKKLNQSKYPVVIMGDLNAKPFEKPIKIISRTFDDVKFLSKDNSTINKSTFNGFKCEKGLPIIDYIFVSKKTKVEVEKYEVLDNYPDCKFPSDHFAVITKLKF